MRRLLHLSLLTFACSKTTPAPTTPPPGELPSNRDPARLASPSGDVRVTCEFDDGWAALVPRDQLHQEDEYLMQALIGLAEDPKFWSSQPEYAPLAPYAARRCGGEEVVFEADGRGTVLLIGRANTFDGADYGVNGVILDAQPGGTFHFTKTDLTLSWPCISCPRVYVWTGVAWELRGEVLVNVIGAGAETTQRRPIGLVRVEGGLARVRLAEEEDETSHVDALLLEIGGVVAAPATTGLEAVDGARLSLVRGDVLELAYTVALPDGDYEAVAVATGYYLPLHGVR